MCFVCVLCECVCVDNGVTPPTPSVAHFFFFFVCFFNKSSFAVSFDYKLCRHGVCPASFQFDYDIVFKKNSQWRQLAANRDPRRLQRNHKVTTKKRVTTRKGVNHEQMWYILLSPSHASHCVTHADAFSCATARICIKRKYLNPTNQGRGSIPNNR